MIKSTFILTCTCVLFGTHLISAQPTMVADGPLEFCESESVTLCVEPEYLSYLWSNGSTLRCQTLSESGSYYAVVVDSAFNIDSSLVASPTVIVVHDPQPNIEKENDTLWASSDFDEYRWYLDDELIVGANEQFHVVAEHEGVWIYRIEVTDCIGCTGVSWWVDFPSSPNSLNDFESAFFQLHPNPTTSTVTITATHSIESITITDLLGRVLLQQRENGRYNTQTLDVSSLAPSVYLVGVETEEGYATVRMVVE